MKWHRIWAVVMRHLIQTPTDFNKLSSVLYWPFLDILIFGFTGAWLDLHSSGLTENRFILLTGVVFWQIITRAGYGISINLLEDIWARNITNLFSTPLSIGEWIIAMVIEGIIMLVAIVFFCALITWGFYSYNIFSLGWWFIPITLLNFFSGLSIGLLAGSKLINWGTRVQSLAWMVSWLFAPVSGAFYPITVLPKSLQIIAQALPLHYTFSSMRMILETGTCPISLITKAFGLTALYLMLTLILFVTMFKKSKESGLARITD